MIAEGDGAKDGSGCDDTFSEEEIVTWVVISEKETDLSENEMADGGGGGGWDPCECIFNHEMAMRRLLSLLRSSQVIK